MQAAAALVLGAFQEQHAGAHPNMWEMVLAFVKAYPSAWHAVDMRKAVLPRLLAFLRSATTVCTHTVCLACRTTPILSFSVEIYVLFRSLAFPRSHTTACAVCLARRTIPILRFRIETYVLPRLLALIISSHWYVWCMPCEQSGLSHRIAARACSMFYCSQYDWGALHTASC